MKLMKNASVVEHGGNHLGVSIALHWRDAAAVVGLALWLFYALKSSSLISLPVYLVVLMWALDVIRPQTYLWHCFAVSKRHARRLTAYKYGVFFAPMFVVAVVAVAIGTVPAWRLMPSIVAPLAMALGYTVWQRDWDYAQTAASERRDHTRIAAMSSARWWPHDPRVPASRLMQIIGGIVVCVLAIAVITVDDSPQRHEYLENVVSWVLVAFQTVMVLVLINSDQHRRENVRTWIQLGGHRREVIRHHRRWALVPIGAGTVMFAVVFASEAKLGIATNSILSSIMTDHELLALIVMTGTSLIAVPLLRLVVYTNIARVGRIVIVCGLTLALWAVSAWTFNTWHETHSGETLAGTIGVLVAIIVLWWLSAPAVISRMNVFRW